MESTKTAAEAAQPVVPLELIESYVREHRAKGDPAAFEALLKRLLPRNAATWVACAELLMHRELPAPAIMALKAAQQKFPADIELKFTLGSALRLVGDGASAEAVLREVLGIDPEHERAAVTLALLHRDRGQNSAAAALLRDVHRRHGGVELTLYLVDLLRKCRREQDAMVICEVELAHSPAHGRLQYTAGSLALTLGRFEDARSWLLASLDRSTPEVGALLPLALTRRYNDPNDPDLARFDSVLSSPEFPATTRSAAAFALGKVYDDLRDYVRANQALRVANGLRREQSNWSVSEWRNYVERQLVNNPRPSIGAPIIDQVVPVFVVGLPRTGTTLVADLLGRHPEVKNRGELPWLNFIARSVEQSGQVLSLDSLRQAAVLYIAQLRQDDAQVRWYVDKNPMNFRYLGLVAALFPNAKVIFCERNRRDTALSIWSQSFESEDMEYAYDFDDIATFSSGHDRLMEHWQRTLPLTIHRVAYESLATSAPQVVAELESFLGLPAYDLVNARSKDGASVNTASVWQVRQPIYTNSIGRAQAYTSLIPELQRFPG
ncbi:MAG: Sulfotransferase [Nevskia sp.]|nr:Sulfotransferase [Nevskia sp.]